MFKQQYSHEPPELPGTTKELLVMHLHFVQVYGISEASWLEHCGKHNLTRRGLSDELLDWLEV